MELRSKKQTGANLNGYDLQDRDLSECDFRWATLSRARLMGSNLRRADLTGAKGLTSAQLAGADLSNARLPDGMEWTKEISEVEESAKSAQTYFVSMLLACTYAWLTLITTKDAPLLTNSASGKLPIIQTEIDIVTFFRVAPWLLLGLFIYFHGLVLPDVWRQLARLPRVFPDERRPDEKVKTGVHSVFIRYCSSRLNGQGSSRFDLAQWIMVFLAWLFVPFTLFGFWKWFLHGRDAAVTRTHIVVLCLSLLSLFLLYWYPILRFSRIRRITLAGITWHGTIVVALVLVLLHLPRISRVSTRGEQDPTIPRWLMDPQLDLHGSKISGANLKGKKLQRAFIWKADLEAGDLRGANLHSARLFGSNLNKADLERADLTDADLTGATLTEAVLERAILNRARLPDANLRKARLLNCDVSRADFSEGKLVAAKLQGMTCKMPANRKEDGVDFYRADLTSATMSGGSREWSAFLPQARFVKANMSSADLSDANLKYSEFDSAVLTGTKLTAAYLADVSFDHTILNRAKLDGATLIRATLKYAQVRKADLTRAIMIGAKLNGADLRGADLTQAELAGADLRDADLRNANLSRVKYTRTTVWKGARYNRATIFTDRFLSHRKDLVLINEPRRTSRSRGAP